MTRPAVDVRLSVARARSVAARARLSGTIGELQERARPAALVHDVSATLKERGSDAIIAVLDTAKRFPARTSAGIALTGLFLARHQVLRLFRRRRALPKSVKSLDGEFNP